uniref:Interferon omega-1-like n=1 Tax=Loxodonta africana TaxID=9785 RepID=G3UK87_LOXAF
TAILDFTGIRINSSSFTPPICSLGCDLPQILGLGKQETFTPLGQMRRFFCLKERKDFRFPRMVYGSHLQKAQAVFILHKMLQQIFNLFRTKEPSTAWNTTLPDQLHNGLYQQLEDLETCSMQAVGEGSVLAIEGPVLAVKRYFQEILYLKEKEHSDCVWEVIRVEISKLIYVSTNLGSSGQKRLRSRHRRSTNF